MKRSPELFAAIANLVAKGHSLTSAGRMCGVSHQAVSKWRRDESEFREAIEKAEGVHICSLVERIDEASKDPKYWTAGAWLLERRYPELYSLQVIRAIEREREAMLAELRKHLDEAKFQEVARALVAAQAAARGSGREMRGQHDH